MTRIFALLVSAVLSLPLLVAAQTTAPTPISDTSKHADTSASRWTLSTVKVAPIYKFQMHDNAMIDSAKQFRGPQALPDSCHYAGEKHLENIRQYTFEGENAEAYLSNDDKYICFQAHGTQPNTCDQIYFMPFDGSRVKRISSGAGRTTCSYIYPGDAQVLYASTQAMYDMACPPPPDFSKGYVWPLYRGYDIYLADTNGTLLATLTKDTLYYDAEATISPMGDKIVFTSTRSGDIDLYSMNLNGTGVKQLTNEEGYDGGAFFSPDGKEIVYRASHPKGKELKDYREFLKEGLVKPTTLEIYVMDADGKHKRQVTHLNGASFAPFFHPDGKHIIFSSNYLDPKGRNFDLFMIKKDGTGLERITYGGGFNSFPMFTKDGKHLVFCSNRNAAHPHNTNILVADWVD